MSAIVIGGGAAGMIAAIAAARRGLGVTLIEKNEKLGKKLYITGKGRCNITNAAPPYELIENVVSNPHFMYSAFYTLDAYGTIDFFKGIGVMTKVERGGRVFPASGKASDVIRAMERELASLGARVILNTQAAGLDICGGAVRGVKTLDGSYIEADSVIVSTGGLAYPSTGSTGDGYKFAEKAGHTVTPLFPSLVSLITKEKWVKDVQGLSLKNVEITVKDGKRKLYSDFGEMIFTHTGISGPIVLSASRFALPGCAVSINLKPKLSEKELDGRLLRDFSENLNRDFINAFDELLPKSLIPVFVSLTHIDPRSKVRDITKEDRRTVLAALRGLTVTVAGNTGFNDAVITAGGVCVDEVNPSTMESKLVKGLFFAGEVLDVDAFTGGYNLQIAFSTGYLAGASCY